MLCRWLPALCFAFLPQLCPAAGLAEHIVLVVWDGMRPDFVTPELTPTLWRLRTNGVWFDRHHSAFPTTTEVNGTALATGAHPRNSGVLANVEFRPAINPLKLINTENITAIRKGDEVTDDCYLALPTLAEMMQQQGLRTAIAGSKGVAVLHDRKARAGENPPGLALFANATLPESLWGQLTNRFGIPPTNTNPKTLRDEWTVRCLVEGLWERGVPRFSLLWMSEPDATQHDRRPGSATALEALRGVDRNLALLLANLERRGLRDKTDVIVVSDHGFSTIAGGFDTAARLRRAGLNAYRTWLNPPRDGDIVVAGTGGAVMLYVIGHQQEVIQKAVTALQQESGIGVLFTRDGLPGTFPLREARLDVDHAADIVISMHWRSGTNTNGTPGLAITDSTSRRPTGGMHGSLGPTDLHNTCVAAGPDFHRGITNSVPSGNVDITPTLLWLLGIKPPQSRDGRVLLEALAAADAKPPVVEQRRIDAKTELPGGTWSQYLSFTEVNGTRYFEEGNGSYTTNAAPAKP